MRTRGRRCRRAFGRRPEFRSVLLRTPTNPERAAACPQCLIELEPEIAEDLLSSVDQPLQVANDKTKAKQYLLCDYNRDGDSYR